jgi:hypothetical protein
MDFTAAGAGRARSIQTFKASSRWDFWWEL